ncbi:YhjD/YihY/BrkB family envelope integrity protein [Mycoplasma tauri]|uniref:YihY/virulence factor BrkB family protein n=1 Tax=Mycoplasma tauri TaxID=547987 RepID=A0A953NCQ8_9MOLU|nr:YhjD/YihY/BrkB family envelope integrity protein [Mycoplasma tauri]MBZ4195462.1 YihY/virulence factor BrkB family protein [Mycoplasma tauri]MBZ4203858.1 YihY/virulence factor BrkB family protein [Mycoplasma tauri]MBZ4203986.1 YihY/virulence factor BrkB family protein [Mycoplasma tauri]MBZ4212798.1 YihY/virulence factor BrkB family protein [Mycoplasma tauri]MBZ4218479.1 YihY/virulence factor BrkB family protein [Mycoplasma tauri]
MKTKIYSNKNPKLILKKYNELIKKSAISKNIIPTGKNKKTLFEIIIMFFIKWIMIITTSKRIKRNKTKINELISRVYVKFTGRDFVFIPISFAFYMLISFIPIIATVYHLLKFVNFNGDYHTLFDQEILQKIIPGLGSFTQFLPNSFETGTYMVIVILFISSILISSGGFARFSYSINYIYRHETTGNWFINRVKGFFTVLFITIFIFVSAFVYLSIYKSLGLDKSSELYKNLFFYIFFSIYLMINLYVGLGLLFKHAPAFKISWSFISLGVLIAAVPTMIFITFFGYLTSLIDYKKFGTFSVFMYIALLVSTMSYFIYLGIIANEGYYKTFHSRYTVPKKIWFKKIIKTKNY